MKRFITFGCVALIGAWALGAQSRAANAQSSPATAAGATATSKLQRQPHERPPRIGSLSHRVHHVQRQDGRPPIGGAAAGNRTRHISRVAAFNASHLRKASEQIASLPDAGDRHVAQLAEAAPASSAPAHQAAAPGQFTVSKEAAEHAIERALVQTGALLLRPGQFEIAPGILYQIQQTSRPDQLVLSSTGDVFVAQDQVRNTLFSSQALLRAGLPWNAQAELSVSYDYAASSTTTKVVGTNLTTSSKSAWGYGDTTLTLTKQITSEGEWMPSVFISGTGNLGHIQNGLTLGNGFDYLKAQVLAVKRQDPLVFTAGFAYQTSFASQGIKPGDEFIPSAGMVFAISPETSLQLSQQVAFIQDSKFHGVTVPGSSQVQGIAQAGILSILAPGVVVNLTAAVGETPDAPDLTVQLSMPTRLN